MAIDIGDRRRIGNHAASGAAAFTDLDGVTTDPTAVTLTIRKPNGATLLYGYPTPGVSGSLTREALGRFYADVTLDVAGVWKIELGGTGAVVTVEQTTFTVAGRLVLT
jgi:hypothetical protein